jgi:hypothetical protein
MLQDGLFGERLARLLHLLRRHFLRGHHRKVLRGHRAGEHVLAQRLVLHVPKVEHPGAQRRLVLVAGAPVVFVQALLNALGQIVGVECAFKNL